MNFLGRELICERLRLTTRQSYRIVGSSRSGLIASDEIVRLLNRARRGIADPLSDIPSDLVRPEDICARTGVTFRQLRAWTRRIRNVAPHFRLNGHTRRYSVSRFIQWLAINSRVEDYS